MTPEPPALVSLAVATANIESCLSTSSSPSLTLSKAGGRHLTFVTDDAIVMTCCVMFALALYRPDDCTLTKERALMVFMLTLECILPKPLVEGLQR